MLRIMFGDTSLTLSFLTCKTGLVIPILLTQKLVLKVK